MKKYSCPACGYDQLEIRPYANMPAHPHPVTIKPPYDLAWGEASYHVCSCCGYEYGNDDNPGFSEPGTSFQDYLREWFFDGAKWFFDQDPKPENWDLVKQLENAGIEIPEYIKVSRQLTKS